MTQTAIQNIITIKLMRQFYNYTPSLSKGPVKHYPSTKNYISDFDGNSVSQQRKRSRAINGDKLQLVQVQNPSAEPRIKNRKRIYSYFQHQPQDEELSKVKNDVLKLQKQILAMKNKKRANQISPLRRFRTQTIPQEFEVLPLNSYQIRRQFLQNQGKNWQNNNQLKPSRKTKLYKINKRPKKFLYDTNDSDQNLSHSFVDNITLKRSRRKHRQQQSQYELPIIYKVRHPPPISRIFRSQKNVNRFKKAGNVILFIIKLRTYNERMRIRRFGIFQKYMKTQLNKKLLQLRSQLISYSKPFFATLIDQENFNYRLHEKDEPILKKQKINSVCKLVKFEIRCIQKCISQLSSHQVFSQLLYILCKHGNYSCTEQLNTAEELGLSCISQYYGYMRADKNLEMSAIISLVFVKMLLYNIFLQPERIEIVFDNRVSSKIIFGNLKLVGNILYELFIELQDELLERAPQIFSVGNWDTLKNTFKFKIAESMTVREGFYQKNQLISGLASNKYIKDIYGTRSMVDERQILKIALKQLHKNIVEYHQEFRKQSFIR